VKSSLKRAKWVTYQNLNVLTRIKVELGICYKNNHPECSPQLKPMQLKQKPWTN